MKFVKVKDIKPRGKQEVYDISTLSQSFIASDIIVHNSMATPHVSGILALMRECMGKAVGKKLMVEEVKAMLQALGHEKSNQDGWGKIDWGMFEEWMSTQYSVEL